MKHLLNERICGLFRSNWQHTLTYWSVFFSFGLCVAFLGPTILDLRCQTHSTLQEITLALHFFVGLGALVSPLIAEPFLSETSCVIGNSSVNTSVLWDLRNKLAGRHVHNISNVPLHTQGQVVTNVSYAFWIMALINLPVPIAILILIYRERLFPCRSDPSRRLLDRETSTMKTWGSTGLSDENSQQTEYRSGYSDLLSCCLHSNNQSFPPSFFWIHILGGLVLFFSDGIVGSFTGFVYSYAVEDPLNLLHKTAGYLSCVFWAAITIGRLSAIPLSYRFKPLRLLIISQVGVVLTILLLLVFSSSSVFLFLGTCCLGLFISSIFPCMLALTEDILDYRGCATTVLVSCAGMGEMLLQVVVGSVMHSQGSFSFLLCGLIFGCLGFVFFVLHYFVQVNYRSYTEALPGNCPVEQHEENGIKTCSGVVLDSRDASEHKTSMIP
ncbi:hypothetical protein DNTS_016392 [Danionella cerebrum]|uniref:Major facilitator superfamily domain-containing protein 4A n=1 Tax=Danionella cerebrum TaxID=2873325 RepID=A0A553R5Y7_9TELE|nr:hypothetical protein DNTS_016392 [Danionella translucida]